MHKLLSLKRLIIVERRNYDNITVVIICSKCHIFLRFKFRLINQDASQRCRKHRNFHVFRAVLLMRENMMQVKKYDILRQIEQN